MSEWDDIISSVATPPSGASEYADSIGLSDMARQGYGRRFIDDMVKSRIASLNIGKSLDSARFSVYRSGLADSGIMDKASATVMSGAAEEAARTEFEATNQNEQFRLGAANSMLGLRMHNESMESQAAIAAANLRAQREAGKTGFLGTLSQVVGIGANFASAGANLGVY